MFRLIKQFFTVLLIFSGYLASILKAPVHITYISINNQQFMTQPTPINLHPNEYCQGLRKFLLAVNLHRCMGRCNTLKDLSNIIMCSKQNRGFRFMCF